MGFKEKFDELFERRGFRDLRQRADIIGGSYEFARKIFNEDSIPGESYIVAACSKMDVPPWQVFELLSMAAADLHQVSGLADVSLLKF